MSSSSSGCCRTVRGNTHKPTFWDKESEPSARPRRLHRRDGQQTTQLLDSHLDHPEARRARGGGPSRQHRAGEVMKSHSLGPVEHRGQFA
jgi:hypothetical protein